MAVFILACICAEMSPDTLTFLMLLWTVYGEICSFLKQILVIIWLPASYGAASMQNVPVRLFFFFWDTLLAWNADKAQLNNVNCVQLWKLKISKKDREIITFGFHQRFAEFPNFLPLGCVNAAAPQQTEPKVLAVHVLETVQHKPARFKMQIETERDV